LDTKIIVEKLALMNVATTQMQLVLFNPDEMQNNLFFGKDVNGNVVFAITSSAPQLQPSYQKTKKLLFWFNAKCNIIIDYKSETNVMHILTCLSDNDDEVVAFVRLGLSFADGISTQNPKKLNELFTSLTNLFASAKRADKIELQGFYAELFIIKYFFDYGINLCPYWQKKDKLKFDFSISSKKRIEIKSTTSEVRIHHFKHEQLLSDLYDIKVMSFMLRRDDVGLSLYDLIGEVREIALGDFGTLLYIENFIKNTDDEELQSIRYDMQFTENHLAFYDAHDVPKFQDEQPQGVSQTEYNSDMTTTKALSLNDLITWIKNEY
jgi:hypothetical protein